jgi:hypothetical protein
LPITAIHHPLAVAICTGSAVGSYAGAHYSDRLGNVWIKQPFVGIVIVMVIKLPTGAIGQRQPHRAPLEQSEPRRPFRFRLHRS